MSELSFTPEDMGFLRGILTDPEDLTRWLVYADWLDDREQSLRAQYLRQTVELANYPKDHPMRDVIGERILELREMLDPNWVMMFDTPRVACSRHWRFQCPQTWASLYATDSPGIRICFNCRQPVFYCHSVEEAEQFASAGQCVAISSRVFPHDRTPFVQEEEVEIGLLRYEAGGDLSYEVDDYEPLDLPTAPEAEPPPRPWWKFW